MFVDRSARLMEGVGVDLGQLGAFESYMCNFVVCMYILFWLILN
jgi:hypothetical protein